MQLEVVIATIKAMISAYIISLPEGMFKAVATAATFLVTINKYILLSTAACFSFAYLLDRCIKPRFNSQWIEGKNDILTIFTPLLILAERLQP